MTKKIGSKKRDAKRRQEFHQNLLDVVNFTTFSEETDVCAKKGVEEVTKNVSGDSAAEIKVDREEEKHVDAKNVIGESALEIEDDGKQSQGPYGSLAGSRKHDIRFRYDVEPPEALWYKRFMEQN